ncbi:HPr family phosphocarrier protein [Oscillibacter sp. MSJ-2]|uniref:Phosphocarrier protein HPr n=1 Tax=Dysosmobacter acutus TaxID=2841504 RepID=A0ABS6F994_9FIRM|nr:HPr family phosphocarrier protein [Dysosmobacter acutus]MBU5626757.1 HPr family phosphocarrier protein [Dysosmobacter acutus]
MITKKTVVTCPEGLHARPAAAFLKTAKRFPCSVYINYKGKTISAKSMVAIMSAGISCGEEVELVCDGAQEEDAIEALSRTL